VKPFARIVESNAIRDVVVCRSLVSLVTTSELEVVAVALEVGEVPAIKSVAP
jgi:hypothetical protein